MTKRVLIPILVTLALAVPTLAAADAFLLKQGATLLPTEMTNAPLQGPDVVGVLSSPFYDKDRNRIFDDLDSLLQTLGDQRTTAIVLFTHPVNEQDVAEYQAQYGDFPVNALWNVIPAFSADLTSTQVLQFAQRQDVKQIEPEQTYHMTLATARPTFGVDKAVTDFGVTGDRSGADFTYTTSDIGVCETDTGIDAAHSDLNNGKVIGWKDYVNGKTAPYDDQGHGSHVAGIIAGKGSTTWANRGVAYGATLIGVKVLDSAGSGSTTNIINGVNWCINNKAAYNIRVLSMSLGGSGSSDGTDSLSVAVNSAADNGIVPVVAAGNSGPAAYTIGSPAAAAKAVTVCAMSDSGTGSTKQGFFVADFSSRGPTADGRTKPDICAPGYNIVSVKANSGTGYVAMSGTSMATPFVSGAVALMIDANIGLTVDQVKNCLYTTSQDWKSTGTDIDTGYGRLQAYEAVKCAGGFTGTGPAVPAHAWLPSGSTISTSGAYDKYTFNVGTTAYPVAGTLIIPGAASTKDFDLYLYNPSGTLVASSTGTTRQETVHVIPTATGTWSVVVSSYTGTGSYYLDISGTGSLTQTVNG